MPSVRIVGAFLATLSLSAALSDEQRARIKAFLKDDEMEHRRLQASGDEMIMKWSRDLNRSFKAHVLRKLGGKQEDGVPEAAPGSVLLPEVYADYVLIMMRLGQLKNLSTKESGSRRLGSHYYVAEASIEPPTDESRKLQACNDNTYMPESDDWWACPSNSYVSGGGCACDTGYQPDADGYCVLCPASCDRACCDNTNIPGSSIWLQCHDHQYNNGGYCLCKTGYQHNADGYCEFCGVCNDNTDIPGSDNWTLTCTLNPNTQSNVERSHCQCETGYQADWQGYCKPCAGFEKAKTTQDCQEPKQGDAGCSWTEIERYQTKYYDSSFSTLQSLFHNRITYRLEPQDGVHCEGCIDGIHHDKVMHGDVGLPTVLPTCRLDDDVQYPDHKDHHDDDYYEFHAIMGYHCDSYPGIVSDCKEVTTDGLPIVFNCTVDVVFMKGVGVHLDLQIRVGFGATGEADDLLVEVYFGMWTDPYPEICLGAFTDISSSICVALETFVDTIIAPFFDIGQLVAGPDMARSVKLYPFQMRFPANRDEEDGEKMQLLFRLPLLSNGKGTGAFNATGAPSLSEGVCFKDFLTKYEFEGMGSLQKTLQLMSFGLGMLGADWCLSFPDTKVDIEEGSLQFGTKIEMVVFDENAVSLDAFWEILPESVKDFTEGSSQPGLEGFSLRAMFQTPCQDFFSDTLGADLDQVATLGEAMLGIDADAIEAACPNKSFQKMLEDEFKEAFSVLGLRKTEEHFDVVKAIKGQSVFKVNGMFNPVAGRRLQQAPAPVSRVIVLGEDLVIDESLGLTVKDDSKCETTVSGMPKHLQCDVRAIASGIELHGRMRAEIGYAMNGVDYIVNPGFGFSLALPTEGLASSGHLETLEWLDEKIDIGAMVHETLSGTIKLSSGSFTFPQQFSEGGLQTLSRIEVPADGSVPICLSNLDEYVPHPGLLKILEYVKIFIGVFGGDKCFNLAIDMKDGLKLKLEEEITALDKDKFEIWPLLYKLADLHPFGQGFQILMSAIDVFLGDLKDSITQDLASVMFPSEKISTNLNIGALLYNAASRGRRLDTLTSNESAGAEILDADGNFNLGYMTCSTIGSISSDNGFGCVMPRPTPPTTPPPTALPVTEQDASGQTQGSIPSVRCVTFWVALPFVLARQPRV